MLIDFFVAAGGSGRRRAGLRAGPDPRRLRRPAAGLQRRRRLLRGAGEPGRPRVGCRALRIDAAGRGWSSRASRLAREGVEITAQQAYFHEILHPILTSTPEAAALYAPEGRVLSEGGRLPLPGRCRTPWSASRPRAPSRSTRGEVGDRGVRMGARARRHAGPGRHGRLRADRARADLRRASAGPTCSPIRRRRPAAS